MRARGSWSQPQQAPATLPMIRLGGDGSGVRPKFLAIYGFQDFNRNRSTSVGRVTLSEYLHSGDDEGDRVVS